jgi:hypothetical protein
MISPDDAEEHGAKTNSEGAEPAWANGCLSATLALAWLGYIALTLLLAFLVIVNAEELGTPKALVIDRYWTPAMWCLGLHLAFLLSLLWSLRRSWVQP